MSKLIYFTFKDNPEDVWFETQKAGIKSVEAWIKDHDTRGKYIMDWGICISDTKFIKFLSNNGIGQKINNSYVIGYNDIIPKNNKYHNASYQGIRHACATMGFKTLKSYGVESKTITL